MLHVHGEKLENDADHTITADSRDKRNSTNLVPALDLPGYVGQGGDGPERLRVRFSLDTAGPSAASAAEYDAISRSAIMTEHDHGLGSSGLRRIRQQHNAGRTPTTASRSPSMVDLTRSSSMKDMMEERHEHAFLAMSSHPSSPTFTEDLTRFPSESLHSFSFAHQSEDYLHSRQNVLQRSIEFMKDRMGWSGSANASDAAIASASARVSGDLEAQNVMNLLAQAHLLGAGNVLLSANPAIPTGPLTGPAELSGENVFEKQFAPRIRRLHFDDSPISPTNISSLLSQAPVSACPLPTREDATVSEDSSRTPTINSGRSGTTAKTSPPTSRRPTMKRTLTDTEHVSMQQKLMDAMAKPFLVGETPCKERMAASLPSIPPPPSIASSTIHGPSTRWVPAAQAIFTTESKPPWTILAANDLACLVFGVTKAEVRKMGILEVVQDERRAWLERRLQDGMFDKASSSDSESSSPAPAAPAAPVSPTSALLGSRSSGITAKLLRKPNSRAQASVTKTGRRPATVHSGDMKAPNPHSTHHSSHKSRGVLLCGDVVPIRKRNGATGSASLWVKEKKVGLIWVLEEIREDVAHLTLDEDGIVTKLSGALACIWGNHEPQPGVDVGKLMPRIPRQGMDPRFGPVDYAQLAKRRYFTCRNRGHISIPATVEQVRGTPGLRVSSFPHIAGIVVVDPKTLVIQSSNSVFSGALFGHERPDGKPITALLPDFDKVLHILIEEHGVDLVDGIVVPEHSFRKASAFLALREGRPDAATSFLRPEGLPARHRDGSELRIDVQMRVVKSEKHSEKHSEPADELADEQPQSESMYALWITYSRHLHAVMPTDTGTPLMSGVATPLHQPSPGQTPVHTPQEMQSDAEDVKNEEIMARQLQEVVLSAAVVKLVGPQQLDVVEPPHVEPRRKKTIDDFIILEEMGQGAYGQVKLARYRNSSKRCVLKYVTKKRILVDTWTRDRRLGTVPLEIHVLDFLRRDGLRHPNVVEMEDFFEDRVNYYIEMVPHGLPGMDLFDYIELRSNMEEDECRSIFVQVARAVHHLHTRALVVHRDIKDENVILDGEGNIKLIDFGSAAYIKSGPFDVFVGTIDYAAPEVLAGKPYGGREQDVWALGILLYTIIYKENPFYSIDEIMDRHLRVPYTISDESIDLVRSMLDRDVKQRATIEQVLEHRWCRAHV